LRSNTLKNFHEWIKQWIKEPGTGFAPVDRLNALMRSTRQSPCFIHFIHRPPASQERARIVFDCGMANDPATINKESTNENNTDVDRWVDARRLRINGQPCS